MKAPNRVLSGAYLILAGLFVLRIVPLFLPESRTWGFNQLLFLPEWWTYAYLALSVTALILPFYRFTDTIGIKAIKTINRHVFEIPHRGYFRIGMVAAMLFLFILFSTPTHFLGDGYQMIANLSEQAGQFFKWSEMGTTLLQSSIYSLLSDSNETAALLTFRIISWGSGILSIYLYVLIARIITDNPLKRLLVLMVLILSGSLLLFFGYVENYPLLQAIYAAFIYFGLRRLHTGRGLLSVTIVFFMGLFLHLQVAMFFPALIYLGLAEGKGNRLHVHYKWMVFAILAVIGIALLGLAVYTYRTDLSFAGHFMPFLTGKAVAPGYTVFSLPHLLDIGNELLLLSPAIMVFVALLIAERKEIRMTKTAWFLIISSLGGLLFLLVIDPKLSMPRDWDLFSLSALAPTLLLVHLLPETSHHIMTRLLPSLGLYLLLAVGMFLSTALNTKASLDNIEYIIHLDRGKSLSSLICLRDFYRKHDMPARADSVNMTYYFYYPNDRMIKEAFDALAVGDVGKAERLLTLIAPDKFNSHYHSLLATYYYIKGNLDSALYETKAAIQLGRYSVDLYRKLGLIHLARDRFDDAASALRAAHAIDPHDEKVIENLAAVFLASQQADSVAYYSNQLITADSGHTQGYVLLYSLYYQLNQSDSAQKYAELYYRFGGSDSVQMDAPQ
ncbi:MAG: hypothetical protein JW763_06645 [candidate division Zixibacteria bacterium]|nr:hypothetical protein [candidate division Zixibacteria bacterium]